MKNRLPEQGLYAITDSENLLHDKFLEITESLLNAGVNLVQYRNKDPDRTRVLNLGNDLILLCNQFEVPLFVNDDPALAADIGAAGVHLGKNDFDISIVRKDFPDLMIGVSCYNKLQRAILAEQQGVDYVAFGAFFKSCTKPDAAIADIDLLETARSILNIPIVAIGGITPENGSDLISAGADFLAVINGLYAADQPYEQTHKYLNLFDWE